MTKRKKPPKQRSASAKALELRQHHPKVIPNKRKRKPRHAVRHDDDSR